MKQIINILLPVFYFSSFSSSKSKSEEQANQIQKGINENSPGRVSTFADGLYINANLDVKKQEATSLMPPEVSARIIGDNNGESISLPFDRRDMVVGEKTNFSSSAVDLFLHDDIVIWGGYKGEMKINKIDENSAEGTFYFTATSTGTDKTVEVTDGFFRILFK